MPDSPDLEALLRPSLADGLRGWTVCAAVPLTALPFTFALTSFLHAKELVFVLLLVVLSCSTVIGRGISQAPFRAYWPLCALLGLAAIVHIIFASAIVPVYAIESLNRMLLLLVFAVLAFDLQREPDWRRRVRAAIECAGVAVAVLAILQYAGLVDWLLPPVAGYDQRVYSVFGNQDLLGGYLAVAFPLMVHRNLREPRFSWKIMAILIVLAALALSASRSAWLAALAGVLIAIPTAKPSFKRLAAVFTLLVAAAVAILIVSPDPTINRIQSSLAANDVGWHARLWFWDAAWRIAIDHPIAGAGSGNFQYWTPYYQGEALRAYGDFTHYHNSLHTLHAHSEPLEIAAEFGLVGVVLVVVMLVRLLPCRGPECGSFLAFLIFALVNPVLHSVPHVLLAIALAGNLLARRIRPTGPARYQVEPHRAPAALVAFAAISCSAFHVWAVVVPSYWLGHARQAYSDGQPAYPWYRRLLDYPWPQYAAFEESAMIGLHDNQVDAARNLLDRAAAGIDTGRLHYLRGLAALEGNHRVAARLAFEECVWRWPGYAPAWEQLLGLLRPAEVPEVWAAARRYLDPAEFTLLRRRLAGAGWDLPE